QLIHATDKELRKTATNDPAAKRLMTVDRVGPITALAYVRILDDPSRFARRRRDVASFVGLVPRHHQSGDSDLQLRISKAANPLLRSLLVNSAQQILGPFGKDSDLRRWGLELAERGGKNGKKRAVVAVARKLTVVMHRIWSTEGEVYRPFKTPPEAAA